MFELLQEFLVGMGGGAVGFLLFEHLNQKLNNPYKWECPEVGCHFEVGSNNYELTKMLVRDHERTHV